MRVERAEPADDGEDLLRLPAGMVERIEAEANARDVPCQSLLKICLDEKLSA